MKIVNINEKFGELVEFSGSDLPECIIQMVQAIRACGYGESVNDLCDSLREGEDYEIIG
jgi:hypothetical protein